MFIFFLTSCTTPPHQISPTLGNLQAELAINTFSTGFSQISQRYINKISVAELAINGLQGLEAIDPTIQIHKNSKTVSIESSIIQKRIYSTPASTDAHGWAKLTLNAIKDGKKDSEAFKKAKMAHLYEVIFDGSLSALDTFSRYVDAIGAKKNREKRSGFGGIGVRFKQNKKGIVITKVYDETPAYRAGLKSQDIITHVGNRSLVGAKHRHVIKLLRGKIGTFVDLRVIRPVINTSKEVDFSSLNFSLKRGQIILPTTNISQKNGILYAQVNRFNSHTAKNLAKTLKLGLKKTKINSRQKTKGIILDLRGNPGGLLKQAIKVSNLFLINGRIISTRGRHPSSNNDYEAYGKDLTEGLPIIIIVNGKTASSAEILAAALQDHGRAVVIGSASFGKGTIQTVIKLPNNGEIAITWSRFQTPSGYFLDKLGVPPTICVTGSEASIANEYIEKTLKQSNHYKKTRLAWQNTTIEEKLKRNRLKRSCPPTNKRNPIDIMIAEKLLNDSSLYSRVKALNLSIASTDG